MLQANHSPTVNSLRGGASRYPVPALARRQVLGRARLPLWHQLQVFYPCEKLLYVDADLAADLSDPLDRLPLGVGQRPVIAL